MKSIFTKLSVLLACGVFAMVGCTDFSEDIKGVDGKVDVTNSEVAQLKDAVEDLDKKLSEQYATKEEVAELVATVSDLQKALEEAEKELQDAIANKADKAVVEAAIQQATDAIAALDGALKEVATENATLKAAVEALTQRVTAAEEALAKAEKALEDAHDQLDTLIGDLDFALGEIKRLQGDITDLQTALSNYQSEVEAEFEAVKKSIADLETKLSAELDAIKESLEDAATVAQVEALQSQIDAINAVLATLPKEGYDDTALKAAIAALEDKHNADVAALNEALAKATAEYKALAAGLQDQIDALAEKLGLLEDAVESLAKELRGIVIVPEILKDGTPAVEFKSFAYVPMAADSDEFVDAEGAADYEIIGSNETVAYYHFNPSNFDIASAQYAVVSTTVETRTAAEPVATVGEVVKDGDKVKVTLLRDKGADNMFALAATLENGAVIYSDYALVLDAQVTAKDLVIVDNDDVALYTTLAETEAASEQITLTSDEEFNFAEYVKPMDELFASFGLEYKYSVVYGDIAVEADGKADLKNGNGVSIIKVEAVNGTDVVRRAYVKVYVNYVEPEIPGIYYTANATATVEASRIAFEVKDILVWAKALKDEPNTIEILKEVADIANKIAEIQASDEVQIQKNYLIKLEAMKAYELLNGVPGFVYKYKTFTGAGEAKVRVEVIPEIMSVQELKAVLKMVEEKYPEADFAGEFADKVENYVPESLKSNWLVASILNGLKDFKLSDILENETVVNLLEAGQALAEKLGTSILDYDKINEALETAVKNMVGENNYGETAAKITAEAKARAAAEAAMKAEVDAANEQLLANFQNGTWGQIYDFLNVDLNLDNEIVAKVLEQLNLTEYVQTFKDLLTQISEQGENLVKYAYDSENVVYTVETVRSEVK